MRRQRGLFVGCETVWVAWTEGSFGAEAVKSGNLSVAVSGWEPL